MGVTLETEGNFLRCVGDGKEAGRVSPSATTAYGGFRRCHFEQAENLAK